jgi:hypothetical protein
MFDGDELNQAMGVPFFYGVVEALVLGLYCLGAWKAGWTKAPSDAPIWKVLVTSYEVIHAERMELDAIEVNVSDSDEAVPEQVDGSVLTHFFSLEAFGDNASGKRKEPSGITQEQAIVAEVV